MSANDRRLADPARGARRDRAPACSRPTTPAAIAASSISLTHHDYFLVCADFDAYWTAQLQGRRGVARPATLVALEHPEHRAHVGWFSSDRTIGEYAQEIWNAPFRADSLRPWRLMRRTGKRERGRRRRDRRRRAMAILSPCSGRMRPPHGWVDPRLRAVTPSSVRACRRDGAPIVELPAAQGRFLRGADRRGSRSAPPTGCEATQRAAATWSLRRPATRSARRWARSTTICCVEGTHRQLYRRLGAQLIDA